MADVQNARETERVEMVRDQNRTPWDEASPAGTNGGPFGISGGEWTMFGAIAAVALAIGIVNALSGAQDAVWHGNRYDVGRRLFWELSSIAVILSLLPILVFAIRRMRRTATLAGKIGIAAGAVAVFSPLHIVGMVWIRKLVLWLAGSSYDFNLSSATLLYEFRKDVVTCLLIGGTLWLIESRRELKRAALPALSGPAAPQQPPSPDLIWLRDGASRIRIEPRQILWVASAGNYIEYSLADGTRHLIRGTLAAAESELVRFHIMRIHRTRLANLDRVTGVDLKPSGDFEITFDNGQALQGSRRYRPSVVALGPATA